MKLSSKVVINIAAVAALSTSFPAVGFARDGHDDSSQSSSPSASPRVEQEHATEVETRSGKTVTAQTDGRNFCARFTTSKSKLDGDFTSRVGKLDSDLSADSNKRHDAEQAFDQKLETERADADKLRLEHFTKLESLATTSAQKQAVSDFETAVKAAVVTRRAAVNQARDTFRATVAGTVSTRQTKINQAVTAFHNAVNTATVQAQASCAAGANVQTVQQTLKTAIQTARANFKASLDALRAPGTISQAAATRVAAVKAANDAFKQSVQAAAAKLKSALGQTDEASPSPTATP